MSSGPRSASGSIFDGRVMSTLCSNTALQLNPLKNGCDRIACIPPAPMPILSPSSCRNSCRIKS
eukprot:29683-Pelagococcus_subviridis.AAC.2